jgi:ribonuclease T1
MNVDRQPRRSTIGLLTLCSLWTACLFGPSCERAWTHAVELAAAESLVSTPAIAERGASVPRKPIEGTAPQKAYDLLAKIQERDGKPLPGYVGRRHFENRERRLPSGRYYEYDVNRKIPGRSRGAERLVIEQNTGKAYYTNDHYRSFLPLN